MKRMNKRAMRLTLLKAMRLSTVTKCCSRINRTGNNKRRDDFGSFFDIISKRKKALALNKKTT